MLWVSCHLTSDGQESRSGGGVMFAQTCRRELPWGHLEASDPDRRNSTSKGPEADSRKSKEAGQCGPEERRSQSGWKKWHRSWRALSALVRALACTLRPLKEGFVTPSLTTSLSLVHLSWKPNPLCGLSLSLIHFPFETWRAGQSYSSLYHWPRRALCKCLFNYLKWQVAASRSLENLGRKVSWVQIHIDR